MDTCILKFYLEYISIRGEEGEKPLNGAEKRGGVKSIIRRKELFRNLLHIHIGNLSNEGHVF